MHKPISKKIKKYRYKFVFEADLHDFGEHSEIMEYVKSVLKSDGFIFNVDMIRCCKVKPTSYNTIKKQLYSTIDENIESKDYTSGV